MLHFNFSKIIIFPVFLLVFYQFSLFGMLKESKEIEIFAKKNAQECLTHVANGQQNDEKWQKKLNSFSVEQTEAIIKSYNQLVEQKKTECTPENLALLQKKRSTYFKLMLGSVDFLT